MTRVIISEDCGNSPKNIFVQELTIAFARGDSKYILSSITDDIRWNIVGDTVIQGKDSFAQLLEEMKKDQALKLTIRHIATHGKAGAVDGTTKFKNGNTHAFCDVYEFSNSKGTSVKEITSYRIEIK
jgi:limonene-1,2-epoxide hydrolase